MTFPDQKYSDITAYAEDYFAQGARAAASVDRSKLAQAAALLADIYTRGATLYVCGNGGSALIADSFVSDHGKLVRTDTDLEPRVISLAGSLSMTTAIANDISYDEVFAYPLESLARDGDGLVTISSSGDSENVVRAARWARDNGLHVLTLTGFDGGRSRPLGHVNLHVEADNYGVIEDAHQALMHLLGQYIRQSRMSEELIRDRKF